MKTMKLHENQSIDFLHNIFRINLIVTFIGGQYSSEGIFNVIVPLDDQPKFINAALSLAVSIKRENLLNDEDWNALEKERIANTKFVYRHLSELIIYNELSSFYKKKNAVHIPGYGDQLLTKIAKLSGEKPEDLAVKILQTANLT